MIAYFPTLYPDELLYSWISRYHTHIGYPDPSRTLMDLLDPLEQRVTHEFTASFNKGVLDYFERHFGTYNALIEQHTLWPYYAKFMGKEDKEWNWGKLKNYSFDITPFQFNSYNRCLMLCPRCVLEDRLAYGEAYFHIHHQFWDSKACWRHKCKLVKSNIRICKMKDVQLVCAEECMPEEMVVLESSTFESDYSIYQHDFYLNDNLYPIPDIISLIKSIYTDSITNFLELERLSNDMEVFYRELNIGKIPVSILDYFVNAQCFDTRLICLLSFFLKIPPLNGTNIIS